MEPPHSIWLTNVYNNSSVRQGPGIEVAMKLFVKVLKRFAGLSSKTGPSLKIIFACRSRYDGHARGPKMVSFFNVMVVVSRKMESIVRDIDIAPRLELSFKTYRQSPESL